MNNVEETTKIDNLIDKIKIEIENKNNKPAKMLGDYDLSKLTPKEEIYFRMMYPKSGVLYLVAGPGLAKSAILATMAEKLDLLYIDLRLSQIDETDVGVYPKVSTIKCSVTENGKTYIKDEDFLKHVIPHWAYKANNPGTHKGCLINFEEINRAPLTVRNAALQLLLERTVGFDGFKFNDNVFMASTGNLGAEDDTDVDELDSAQRSRLLKVQHDLPFTEWRDTWAQYHIHPLILGFLEAEKEYYYMKPKEQKDYFLNPRTWRFYSDFIVKNYGMNSTFRDFQDMIQQVGHSYVGALVNSKFMQYCEDMDKITINDIVNKYSEIRSEITLNRTKRSEFLDKMKKIKIISLKDKQIENIKLFLLDLRSDESTSYFFKLLKEDYIDVEDKKKDEEQNGGILSFLRDKRFEKIITAIGKNVSEILSKENR